MYKSRLSKCKITGNARTKTDDGSGTSAPVVFSIGDRAISHQETGKFWGQIENQECQVLIMGSGRFGKIFEGYFLKGKENPYFKLISVQDVF